MYLSPINVEAQVALEGLSTVALASTTIATTPNKDDNNGALYAAFVFIRVNTLDGGTTPTLGISLTYTEGASARTKVLSITNEAGAAATSISLGAANTGHSLCVFRADKATDIKWTRVAGGTASNDGNFDVFITVLRIK